MIPLNCNNRLLDSIALITFFDVETHNSGIMVHCNSENSDKMYLISNLDLHCEQDTCLVVLVQPMKTCTDIHDKMLTGT